MLNEIAVVCLAGAVILLVALSVIDFRHRLLPNELVAAFAAVGLAFHFVTQARFVSVHDILLGGLFGFAGLFLVRTIANRLYGEDALGLGDVKLIGAAGLWLGPQSVMLALAMGALAALVHGVIYGLWLAFKTKTKPDFANLQVPAGPGFAVGIVAVGAFKFLAAGGLR